jgi:hypothetical protein
MALTLDAALGSCDIRNYFNVPGEQRKSDPVEGRFLKEAREGGNSNRVEF